MSQARLIPIIAFGLLMVLTPLTLTISPLKAAPNCDKADLERNKDGSGNVRGNSHCDSFPGEDGNPPEPTRDCDKGGKSNAQHKNAFKDNDEDGSATCILRGSGDAP